MESTELFLCLKEAKELAKTSAELEFNLRVKCVQNKICPKCGRKTRKYMTVGDGRAVREKCKPCSAQYTLYHSKKNGYHLWTNGWISNCMKPQEVRDR